MCVRCIRQSTGGRLSMLIAVFIWISVFVALLWYWKDWLRAVIASFHLPGPPTTPLLGNVLLLTHQKRLWELGSTSYKEYGTLFRVWVSIHPTFVVIDPHDVQVVLGSLKHTNKNYFYKLLHNFIGKGLITDGGEKWRLNRRLLQQAFHNKRLDGFIPTFWDASNLLLERVRASSNIAAVNVTSYVNQCILDILYENVLGVPVNQSIVPTEEFLKTSPFRSGKVLAPHRITRPWLLLNWIYSFTEFAQFEVKQRNHLENYIKKIIQERTSLHRSDKKVSTKEQCLLDILLEIENKNPVFTHQDVINEACTFMLAGQESVSTALALCLHLLANHPQAQEIAAKELEEIFQGSDRSPTREDLQSMRYIEKCIKETLRLYPSIPMLGRTLDEDVILSNIHLPKGSSILLLPYVTHRLPDVYPDPEKFKPERFNMENISGRHPYSYLPFSAGPRNCLGMKLALLEMKTVVSTILRQFQLLPVQGRETLNLSYRITIRAQGGIWINFVPRNSLVNIQV